MKSVMRSLLIIFLFCFSGKLVSQDAAMEPDRVYGLDQVLYNGKKYTYFLPAGTGGNQFLSSPDYYTGEVTIRGRNYNGISLNYDIFNQLLLLQYTNETGALNVIEISKAWLESFRLDNLNFQYLSFNDGPRFYQVLGNGPLHILCYWRKDLKLDGSYGSSHYTFMPPVKSCFVLNNDKLQPFRNKRSLISLFDPRYSADIRNYMHRNRIKLKKATDGTMSELIDYIGNLE